MFDRLLLAMHVADSVFALEQITVMPYVDEITEQAKMVGSVNTTYFREKPDGGFTHVGTNLDVAGVGNSLLSALSGQSTPFADGTPLQFRPGKVAGLMIGKALPLECVLGV